MQAKMSARAIVLRVRAQDWRAQLAHVVPERLNLR